MVALNFVRHGAVGNPVVLLHGLFGSARNWGSVARRLADNHDVIVPDLRNHGDSPHHPTHAYQDMVDDTVALLDTLDIESASMVGHSMGGKVAMLMALRHPQRVRRLAVVDIAPVTYGHDFDAVFAAMRSVDLAHVRNRAEADQQMRHEDVGDGVRAFLLQNLVSENGTWRWRLNLDGLEQAQEAVTGFPATAPDLAYRGVSHFIYGALSDYVQDAFMGRIRQLFPAARMCPVADAGHWVYAEQPQAFTRCLDEFLDAE